MMHPLDATVKPSSIEFVTRYGGGETVGRLLDCLVRSKPVPRDVVDYVNGALAIMLPNEFLGYRWVVDRMEYRRGSEPTVRVVLVRDEKRHALPVSGHLSPGSRESETET